MEQTKTKEAQKETAITTESGHLFNTYLSCFEHASPEALDKNKSMYFNLRGNGFVKYRD